MILDGKALASKILARTEERAAELAQPPRVAVIVANETAATRSYLAIKEKRARDAGCRLEVIRLPENASALELRLAVDGASSSGRSDVIVVQLPLPLGVDPKEVCDAIPLEKDADILSTLSRMRFEANETAALVPPVAGALAEILESFYGKPRTKSDLVRDKRAVVLGEGWLVGKPCATWLTHAGADVIHTHDLGELRLADIIVSGMGAPHLIKPDLLKEGVVLIDAGTSESGGVIVGDADPVCAATCSLFTPVPGGVGPVAVAKLFENVVVLAGDRH